MREHDLITIWHKTGDTDLYGNSSYSVRTSMCRYEQLEQLRTGEFGQASAYKGRVISESLQLDVGDMVALGDYLVLLDPPTEIAQEIKNVSVISNLRNSRTIYQYSF